MRPVLTRVIARITRNTCDTEDLLQEAYLRILRWTQTNEPGELKNIRAFAIRIARNVTLDWVRHHQTVMFEYSPTPEEEEEADLDSDVCYLVAAEQELDVLATMVGRLPERCRQAFTLRKVYGMGQKEIASVLSISENTVEQHLAKAARRIGEYQREVFGTRDPITLGNPYRKRKQRTAA